VRSQPGSQIPVQAAVLHARLPLPLLRHEPPPSRPLMANRSLPHVAAGLVISL
jgi:hypothetical protein